MDEQASVKREFDLQEFLKKWLWLVAIVFAAVVFLALTAPQFEQNVISVSGGPVLNEDGEWTSGYVFEAVGESEVFFASFFENGVNWMVLWVYMLPVVSLILLIIGAICRKYIAQLSLAASMVSLVAGVLILVSPSLLAYGECWHAIGYDIALDWGGPGYDYLAAAAPSFSSGTLVMAVLLFVSAIVSLSLSTQEVSISIRDISEIGILSALAIALQFIRIPVGASGGSINLGLVPLSVIALRHGPTKGFIAGGLVYGLITCLTDGYGFQTYPFDYLIGFGSIACLGFFSKLVFSGKEGWNKWGFLYIAIGSILMTLVRLFGSTVSSMVIYGYNLPAAIAYNGVYIPVTGAITLACLEALYIPMARVNLLFPSKRIA